MTMHRILLTAIIAMIVAGGVLTILKLWFPLIGIDEYLKVMATLGILALMAALVLVLKVDLGQHKSLKDDNYID